MINLGCVIFFGMENKVIYDVEIDVFLQLDNIYLVSQVRLYFKVDGSKLGSWLVCINDLN